MTDLIEISKQIAKQNIPAGPVRDDLLKKLDIISKLGDAYKEEAHKIGNDPHLSQQGRLAKKVELAKTLLEKINDVENTFQAQVDTLNDKYAAAIENVIQPKEELQGIYSEIRLRLQDQLRDDVDRRVVLLDAARDGKVRIVEALVSDPLSSLSQEDNENAAKLLAKELPERDPVLMELSKASGILQGAMREVRVEISKDSSIPIFEMGNVNAPPKPGE